MSKPLIEGVGVIESFRGSAPKSIVADFDVVGIWSFAVSDIIDSILDRTSKSNANSGGHVKQSG